jgi:hypothetical protein
VSSDTNWELDLKPARPHSQEPPESSGSHNDVDIDLLGALVDIRRSLDRLHARLHVIEQQLGMDVRDELAKHRPSATSQLRETRARVRPNRADDDSAQPTSLSQAAGAGGARRGKKLPPAVVA